MLNSWRTMPYNYRGTNAGRPLGTHLLVSPLVTMVTFTSALAALAYATTLLANQINTKNPLISTPNGNGTHDGFFWMFWTDNQAGNSIEYTNEVKVPAIHPIWAYFRPGGCGRLLGYSTLMYTY